VRATFDDDANARDATSRADEDEVVVLYVDT
jgi:hypothetical protein